MKYGELPNETERKGEQEESDRKKERGKSKGEKNRRGSEKLTLSFPESSAYSFKNSNDSHWESTEPRPERRLCTHT